MCLRLGVLLSHKNELKSVILYFVKKRNQKFSVYVRVYARMNLFELSIKYLRDITGTTEEIGVLSKVCAWV